MLGCRLIFEACAKTVKQKTVKCFLRTTEVLSDADGHVVIQVQYLSKYHTSKLFSEPQNLFMYS